MFFDLLKTGEFPFLESFIEAGNGSNSLKIRIASKLVEVCKTCNNSFFQTPGGSINIAFH